MPDSHDRDPYEKFPTRDDVKTAADAMQQQLDQRFECVATVAKCEIEQRDIRYAAEQAERDKAINVLAAHLREQVRLGDDNLKQHIENQIQQIKVALDAADELEEARIEAVRERLDELNRNGHATIETRISGVEREVALINEASEKAIAKAEAAYDKRFESNNAANDKRFESVNNFRAQFNDELKDIMGRKEATVLVNTNTSKIADLTDRMNRSEGRGTGMNQIWGYIVGGGGLIVALIAIMAWVSSLRDIPKINTQRIDDLTKQTAKANP